MAKEKTYRHTLGMLRLYDHMERQGPEGLTMLGIARHFSALPKKIRIATIVQMDTEMQALATHRGKPYSMPAKAYKRAVEDGMLIRPEGKKATKAWVKVRTRALEKVSLRFIPAAAHSRES